MTASDRMESRPRQDVWRPEPAARLRTTPREAPRSPPHTALHILRHIERRTKRLAERARAPRKYDASRRDDIIGRLQFRYIAVEGAIGAGKTTLAERIGTRLDATVVLEETENPFLADFYADRPGAALQAQLFYLLSRHRQQMTLRQADLFSQATVSDYLFDRDKIFAYLNLDDNELFIYQRLYELLARDVPTPDLAIYLQTPTDVLLRRVHSRRLDPEAVALQPDDDYLRELNEAYHHFFFHYNATPLLVVETSQFDSDASDEALDDLIKQIRAMGPGTRYYVPRTK